VTRGSVHPMMLGFKCRASTFGLLHLPTARSGCDGWAGQLVSETRMRLYSCDGHVERLEDTRPLATRQARPLPTESPLCP